MEMPQTEAYLNVNKFLKQLQWSKVLPPLLLFISILIVKASAPVPYQDSEFSSIWKSSGKQACNTQCFVGPVEVLPWDSDAMFPH